MRALSEVPRRDGRRRAACSSGASHSPQGQGTKSQKGANKSQPRSCRSKRPAREEACVSVRTAKERSQSGARKGASRGAERGDGRAWIVRKARGSSSVPAAGSSPHARLEHASHARDAHARKEGPRPSRIPIKGAERVQKSRVSKQSNAPCQVRQKTARKPKGNRLWA